MTATRPIFPVSVSFTLILLLAGSALGVRAVEILSKNNNSAFGNCVR